jgi:hypothetical protein
MQEYIVYFLHLSGEEIFLGTPGLQGLNGVKGMKNKFIMSVDILYLQLKTTPGVPT